MLFRSVEVLLGARSGVDAAPEIRGKCCPAEVGLAATALASAGVVARTVAAGGAPVLATMGDGQAPNALNRVHAVANPGVSVISVHGVGRAGWKQSAHWMLTLQNHRFDGYIQALEFFKA